MTQPAPQRHSIFMTLKATPAWLALPPAQRFGFLDATIRPLLAAHPAVALRYFDAEAYSAQVSDVALWETDDLAAYHSVVEALRETRFWDDYFAVVAIIPSIESGFAQHYGVAPLNQFAGVA